MFSIFNEFRRFVEIVFIKSKNKTILSVSNNQPDRKPQRTFNEDAPVDI